MDGVFLSAGEDIRTWDARSMSVISILKVDEARCVTWIPASESIAYIAKRNPESTTTVFTVDVTKSGRLETPMNLFASLKSSNVNKTLLAVSNAGSIMACGNSDGSVEVVDLATKTLVKVLSGKLSCLSSLCWTADNSLLIVADSGGILLFYGSEAEPSVLRSDYEAVVVFRLLPFNNRQICCGHSSGVVSLLDLDKMEFTQAFQPCHLASCRDIAFCPANFYLCASVGMDNQLLILNFLENRLINGTTTDSSLCSVAFFPDGKSLICGTSSGKILLFDITKSSSPNKTLLAHSAPVVCLAFRPAPKKPSQNRPISPERLTITGTALSAKTAPATELRVGRSKSGKNVDFTPELEPKTVQVFRSKETSSPKSFSLNSPSTASIKNPVIAQLFNRQTENLSKGNRLENGSGDHVQESVSDIKRCRLEPAAELPGTRESVTNPSIDKCSGLEEKIAPCDAEITTDFAHVQEPSATLSVEKSSEMGEKIMPAIAEVSEIHPEEELKNASSNLEDDGIKLLENAIMECRINCLDGHDLIHEYGGTILQRLSNLEEDVKLLRRESQQTNLLARHTFVLVQENNMILRQILNERGNRLQPTSNQITPDMASLIRNILRK